jgi:hypothetical protein
MGLSFTIADGSRQRCYSQMRVPRDWWPYFTASDSRLLQPGGLGPRIYISQIQGGPVIPPVPGFCFRRLLRFAELRWRYSTPLPHVNLNCQTSTLFFIAILRGPNRKHRLQQYLYFCFRIRCRGNIFTQPLPSNGRLLWLHYSDLQASCHNTISLNSARKLSASTESWRLCACFWYLYLPLP